MYARFKGKVVSVMATSPGPMGCLRMVRSLNQMLQVMFATIVPGANAIGSAFDASDKDRAMKEERAISKIEATCENLEHFCPYETDREQDCDVA
jgi:NAD(P)H-dependent FMN reductase